MDVDHVAACPAISPPDCAAQDIPPHMHHQSIRWLRSTWSASIGLGKGWQVQANIPIDLRLLGIEYSLDGEPYEPPYQGIHHRDETLFGISDPSLLLQRYQGFGDFVVGLSAGTTVPLGRTEENPFALAREGKEHQHFQLGTGTFVPMARAEGFWSGVRWRAIGWAQVQLPVYESARGYTPPRSISYGLTGGYRLTPKTQLLTISQSQHVGPESWSGDTSNTPGRDLIMLGGGALHAVNQSLTLQGQAHTTIWQRTRSAAPEDQLVQRLLLTFGLSWTPNPKSTKPNAPSD